MNRASVEAKILQDLLKTMVHDMMQRNEEVATSYETALQVVTGKANSEAEIIMTTLGAAVSSSALLQSELVSNC